MIYLIIRISFLLLLVSVTACVQDPGVVSKCPFYDSKHYAVPDTFWAYFPSDSLGARDSTFFETEDGQRKDTIIYQNAFYIGTQSNIKNRLFSLSNRDQRYEAFKCSEYYRQAQSFISRRDTWSFSTHTAYPNYRSGSPYDNLKEIDFSIGRYTRKEKSRINGGRMIFHFQFGKSKVASAKYIRFVSDLRLNNGKSYAKALALGMRDSSARDTVYFAQNVGLVAYTVDGKMYYRK